ncbi:MAG: ATP-dependent protease [Proteobacteria bacterium]|nr:MAG: ATP-dependent protease [Pseudomonadota bacterium]
MLGRYDRSVDETKSHALAADEIALFPLSNVVLFPRVHCPLHVFEPRYRQMTADALAGARRIGMVTVRPEHEAEMAGDPPLFAIGCAGAIEQADRRPDGRYDVVLLGTQRFRIVEEIPRSGERLYRVARVELLGERFDESREGIALQGLRADAIELLVQLLRMVAPDAAHQLDPRRFSGIDDTTFVSALCQMLELPPAEKQGLLEADGPMARCEHLVALLQFRIAELGGGLPGPSGVVH